MRGFLQIFDDSRGIFLGTLLGFCIFASCSAFPLFKPLPTATKPKSIFSGAFQEKSHFLKCLGATAFVDNLYRSFDAALLVLRSASLVDEELGAHPVVQELLSRCDEFLRNRSERGALGFGARKVLVIEGIDATGKSTIVQRLCDEHGFESTRTPPERLEHMRAFLNVQPPAVQRAFYTLSNYLAVDELSQSKSTKPLVFDRYYASTCAYTIGSAAGITEADIRNMGAEAFRSPADLPEADLTIVLECSDEVRRQRMQGRKVGNNLFEERYESQKNLAKLVMRAYDRMLSRTTPDKPWTVKVNADGGAVPCVAEIVSLCKKKHIL